MEGALELVVDGREVTVAGVGPDDTVARLAALVAPPGRPDERAGAGVTVDGHLVPGTATLAAAGVGRGSHVVGPHGAAPTGSPGWELVWRAGPCAGRVEVLGPGTHVVGRWLARPWIVTLAPGAPPAVRSAAAGSTGAPPFAVDAVPDRAGIAPPPPTGRGTGPWTVTWNRPPRAAPPVGAEPVEPPPPPAAATEAVRTGVVLPLAVSAVGSALMAVVLGQPLWLLLGAVGLVGAVTGRWQQRRHDRRAAARRAQAEADAVDAFALAVAAQHAAAREGAADRPDVVATVRAARPPSAALWSHRPGDHDAFVATVGVGSVPWAPTLAGRADHPAIAGVLAAHDRLVDVPVPIRLGPGVVVGIAGPRRATRSLARSLVLQLAVRHGPADLRVLALASSSVSPWTSLGWLPHGTHPVEGTPMVAAGDAAVDRLVTSLGGAAGGTTSLAAPNDRAPGHPPLLVAVVDGAELLGSATATARPLLAGRRGPCAAVVLADRALALPASCTVVLELDPNGRGILRSAGLAAGPGPVSVAGVDRGTAAAVGVALARFEDADAVAVSPLPAVVRLTDVLGPGATDPHRLGRAWRALDVDPPPRAPIAVAADGPVEIDLERDGPHALVAGTTGAGKSELLRTLVAALAVRSRPADLSFVLIDYKGGAAFDACAALPTWSGSSPISTTRWPNGRWCRWRPRCAGANGCCAPWARPTCPPTAGPRRPSPWPGWWWWSTSSPRWPRSCRAFSPPSSTWPGGAAAWACTWCWPPSARAGR